VIAVTVECEHCYKMIEDDKDLVEYDQLPYHTECIKEMFREDNPNLSEEKYEEFDEKAEVVDKFERSGEILIPVVHEKSRAKTNKNAKGGSRSE